jgi:hypothetical protein
MAGLCGNQRLNLTAKGLLSWNVRTQRFLESFGMTSVIAIGKDANVVPIWIRNPPESPVSQ